MLSSPQESQVRLALARAMGRLEDARFICLGELDGRALVFVSNSETSKEHGISALGSSLLALSETFAKEALANRAAYNLIKAESGCLVTVRVAGSSRGYVLSLAMQGDEAPAMALRTALDAAQELASMLD